MLTFIFVMWLFVEYRAMISFFEYLSYIYSLLSVYNKTVAFVPSGSTKRKHNGRFMRLKAKTHKGIRLKLSSK